MHVAPELPQAALDSKSWTALLIDMVQTSV
jgi:hypothetical protein